MRQARPMPRQGVAAMVFAILIGALSLPFVGCGKSSEAKKEETASAQAALSDVLKECEYQQKWPHRIRSVCTRCMSLSTAPACGCSKDQKEYSALCHPQQKARKDNKSCEPVTACTWECKPSDCACIAKCYDGHPECNKLASAEASCVSKVCDSFCK